jgi:hypothetical protein
MQRKASHSEFVYAFPTETFDIRGAVAKALGIVSQDPSLLRNIHATAPDLPQLTFEEDTRTKFHKQFYGSSEFPALVALYRQLVQECILPMLQEETGEREFLVQREPSFRVHLPNNTALGRLPADDEKIGLHCDADYNHPAEEINFVLTITGQADTNSFYVESAPGKGNYLPVTLQYGEVFRFYGNQCRHYNRVNQTGATRISLDFRVIPGALTGPVRTAVHSGRPFTAEEGGYYVCMRV